MSKIKNQTIPNIGKDVEHLKLSYIADGKLNGSATFRNSLAISYKIRHILMMQPTLPILSVYPNENGHPHKNLYMDVFSSFIMKKIAKNWKPPNCSK